MKKNIMITVDIDAWVIAKEKGINISQYLSECLRGLVYSVDEDTQEIENIRDKIIALEKNVNDFNLQRSVLITNLKIMEEKKKKERKELEDKEKLKRWRCPVCKSVNEMSSLYCLHCNLPTRDDKKTTTIYLKEDFNV